MVEQNLTVRSKDVSFHTWGILVSVHRTKTISFKERVLEVPFTVIPGSPFCVASHITLLMSRLPLMPNNQLISYLDGDRLVRGTYSWLCSRIRKTCHCVGIESFTSHSLRRGGATALSDAGFSLLDIKDLGDWRSLSVLYYLTKTLAMRIEFDRKVVAKLFI